MNADILYIVQRSFDAGREAEILEDIFKNKPFLSKSEARLYFGEEVPKWIKTEVVPIKKNGRNRKAEIPVSALIHARVASKSEKAVRKTN